MARLWTKKIVCILNVPDVEKLKRMRLSVLLLNSIYNEIDTSKMKMLHISPENALRKKFKMMFGSYTSADLYRKDVDYQFDIQNIPFENETFDLVFCFTLTNILKMMF